MKVNQWCTFSILEYRIENQLHPAAIMGTAGSAAISPTNLQRVKRSCRNTRASSTVTAGYSEEMTTASSRRPVWLAWTKSIVPAESMQPVSTAQRTPAGVMSRNFPIMRTIRAVMSRPPARVSDAIRNGEASPAWRTQRWERGVGGGGERDYHHQAA